MLEISKLKSQPIISKVTYSRKGLIIFFPCECRSLPGIKEGSGGHDFNGENFKDIHDLVKYDLRMLAWYRTRILTSLINPILF
jgi:hypothetical protein